MYSETILTADNLTRRHKGKVWLDGFSLELIRGRVYGLVGPEKSGKTMLLRALLGMIRLDSGVVRWNLNRRNVSALVGEAAYYRDLTIRENLREQAKLFNPQPTEARITEIMDRLAINPANVGDRMMSHSTLNDRGYAAVAMAMLSAPELLVLDDPFTLLDPIWKEKVVSLIRDEYAHKTVLIATRNLGELDDITSNIYFIKEGKNYEI